MFYLELKDGEKIFTGDQEDDHAAFRKIIEDKLGKDALWDIWSILMENEEDYSDSDKVREISKVIDNTV